MGVLDALANATPSRKTVTMCLNGETQARVDAVDLQAAVDQDKLAADFEDPTKHFRAAVLAREELVEEVAASQVTFVFEALPWDVRVELQAEHPPRPGNLADAVRNYNFQTFLPALVRKSVVEVTDAAGDTKPSAEIPDATWTALLGTPSAPATHDEPEVPAVRGSLNYAQVNKLVEGATAVNEKDVLLPKSGLSLLGSQDSKENSAPPSPGTSAPDASGAGNPPTSPTSSTGPTPTGTPETAPKSSSDGSDDS